MPGRVRKGTWARPASRCDDDPGHVGVAGCPPALCVHLGAVPSKIGSTAHRLPCSARSWDVFVRGAQPTLAHELACNTPRPSIADPAGRLGPGRVAIAAGGARQWDRTARAAPRVLAATALSVGSWVGAGRG